jgi:hypothetical protein
VIETGSHRGGDTVVEVGMGNGAISGRGFYSVLSFYSLGRLLVDGNARTLKSVRLVRLRRSAPKPKKRLAKSQS